MLMVFILCISCTLNTDRAHNWCFAFGCPFMRTEKRQKETKIPVRAISHQSTRVIICMQINISGDKRHRSLQRNKKKTIKRNSKHTIGKRFFFIIIFGFACVLTWHIKQTNIGKRQQCQCTAHRLYVHIHYIDMKTTVEIKCIEKFISSSKRRVCVCVPVLVLFCLRPLLNWQIF